MYKNQKPISFFDEKNCTKLLLIMKLTILLTLVATLQVFASTYSQSTKLTLQVSSASIEELISIIESQSDFTVFYKDNQLDAKRTVDLNMKNATIAEVLNTAFLNTDLTFKVLDKIIVITNKSLIQKTISGVVTSAVDGQPLPGVNVSVKGSKAGTITDLDGKYSIEAEEGSSLVFSFMGYVTQELAVGNQTIINVVMAEDTKVVDEVVVIGYGTRAKKDVTTSISSIDAKNIDKVVAMSGEMAMQGNMSGVQVSGNSGNPMFRPTIRIRGINTWGVTTPLYVVDGVPVVEYGAGIEGLEDPRAADVRGPMNIMATIDPNDIESISVLKDASAAAIYGVRAANGVILITTKKGRGDKPSVEFSARYGFQNINQKVDVLNTSQYTKHVQDVYASDPTSSVAPENEGLFDPNDPRYLGNSPTYDWQDAVRADNAPTQDYSLRVTGGTDKTDYYFSAGYGNTQGTVIQNYLERYSTSFKLNSQINKFVKLGINYRLAVGEGSDEPYGFNYWERAQTPPWQPIYDENGPGGFAPTVQGLLPDGTYSSTKLYGTGTRIHIPGQATLNSQTYKSMRNMGTAYIELTPFKGLKVRGNLSIDSYNFTRFSFINYESSVFNYTAGDPRAYGGGTSVGSYEERDVKNFNMIGEFSINYNNTFGDHSIDVLLNVSNQQYKSMYKGTSSEYMTTINPDLRSLGGENQYTSVGSVPWEKSALVGMMARAGYNYKSKYYLDATVRRDGSSRFGPENRWGIFPSFSAAWRMTGEDFMGNIEWLTDLKLRAGWGQLGNQEVTPWAYLSPITTRPTYAWGNNPDAIGKGNYSESATVFGMANEDLTWEKLTTINVGFDATLIQDLNFSFEYYNKLNDGILQTVNLPGSVGLVEQPKANIASVRNTGIEVSLNYTKTIGELILTVGGNLTTVKNTVESTYENIPLWNIEKGYPMYYIKGYKYGGIFQTQEEVDAWLADNEDVNYQEAKIAAGDTYYFDQRSAPTEPNTFYKDSLDNKIDQYDQVYLGKTLPGFFYGLNIDAQYKGFDFSAQFTGVGDVDKINEMRMTLEYTPGTGNNLSTDILNSWTPTNTNTNLPRVIYGDPANNFRLSDRFMESGAYLRLSNIQIGYTLPGSFYNATKQYIKNTRIYLGFSNLFTITKYSGFDPENDNYPTPRVVYFGLNVKF
ncbi:MAG: TonB-dependent receptor [Bacteroidales bacterium]